MTNTEALIRLLVDQVLDTGTWQLTADEIADRYDAVDAYRAMYETGLLGTELFGPDNPAELLVLLDKLAGRDYRQEFRAAGLFLTHEDRIELTERFVRVVKHAVVLHVPEPDTFRAMLADSRRYDVARFTYLETFLPRAELVERCLRTYMEDLTERREAAGTLESTVRAYLLLLLQRHVVDLEDLAPALFDILETVARHEGFLPRGRTHHEQTEQSSDPSQVEADQVRKALSVLEIRGGQPSRTQLRDAYRRLMRRYHPDINPDGLERSKQITAAYAVLVESFGG
jgi:hypothetical protein